MYIELIKFTTRNGVANTELRFLRVIDFPIEPKYLFILEMKHHSEQKLHSMNIKKVLFVKKIQIKEYSVESFITSFSIHRMAFFRHRLSAITDNGERWT